MNYNIQLKDKIYTSLYVGSFEKQYFLAQPYKPEIFFDIS